MKRLWIWAKRLALVVLVLVIGLLAPIAYVETMCRGEGEPLAYKALIDPAYHRLETRSLMTYPEWHIVHAYEDYAKVLRTGDPHDYSFLKGIGGFWSSLCALTRTASAQGEIDSDTKQMVYVIGVSFTAELGLKAAYEETFGRLFVALRGEMHAPLDDLSAEQAAAYAEYLQQVPWYNWHFREDAKDLRIFATDLLRDKERRFALGVEYRTKAAYAEIIADAVANTGADELTLRMIVTGADATDLDRYKGVSVVTERLEGIEIETPRYRALSHLMQKMAIDGLDFIEIAGNDDILVTVLSDRQSEPEAVFSTQRQGFGDYRHLILIKVADLADRLRAMDGAGLRLEHIHDY